MHYIFTTFFYAPLYNSLIFFISVIPYHNVGVAVILFICVIKLILFPLSAKSVKTQFEMKRLEPELKEIKAKYKDNRQVEAEKTMQLYKEKGINPLSGVFLLLLQLPVIIALYYVVRGNSLVTIDHTILYSFVKIPQVINPVFLGVSVFDKSFIFAILAGVTQFLQMHVTLPKTEKKNRESGTTPNFKDELARSMNMQMKYVMPIIIFFIAEGFPIVVSLYLITSSLFAIAQELYIRKTMMRGEPQK